MKNSEIKDKVTDKKRSLPKGFDMEAYKLIKEMKEKTLKGLVDK